MQVCKHTVLHFLIRGPNKELAS